MIGTNEVMSTELQGTVSYCAIFDDIQCLPSCKVFGLNFVSILKIKIKERI